MILNLMIRTENAYQEFVLPNIDNADYVITLRKDIYGFAENCNLLLEVVDGAWSLVKNGEYVAQTQNGKSFGKKLENGDVFNCKTRNGEYLSIIVVETDVALQIYKKYNMAFSTEVSIGKEEGNAIMYDFLGLVSRRHARIVRANDGYYIEDISANGVFVNGIRTRGTTKLKFGDCINIFGLHIICLGEILGVCAIAKFWENKRLLKAYEVPEETLIDYGKRERKEKHYFHRSPRNIPRVYNENIEIMAPPNPVVKKKKPLLMTIGPSFTMAIPMMMGSILMVYGSTTQRGISSFTGMTTAICSAIIGVTWALVNLKYANEEEKKAEESRFGAYSKYLIEITEFIKKKHEYNEKVLNESYPSAEVCCNYDENSAFLWNRNEMHNDFLFVRLGIGDIDFQAEIKIPKKTFGMIEDHLAEKPKAIYDTYKRLKNIPVGVDLLKERLIGIVGGTGKKGAYDIAKVIITQLVATTCYTDVKLIVAYDEKSDADRKEWAFAKWLPHVWAEDKKNRYFATNRSEASDVFYEIVNIIRIREEENKSTTAKNEISKPHFVLFLSDAALLEGELLSKYVLQGNPEYGLTTFLLAERYEDLPNVCEQIIQNDEKFCGMYNVQEGDRNKTKITFDHVSLDKLEQFTRRLSGIEVNLADSNGEMPNSLDFFEMYGVSSLAEFKVLERWKKNRTYESMKALIGKKSATADCYLDIHEKYHGPHGLIAGTTGSGKSETLQTYMLSLAINFSPYDVGFFVIDFKGGGMANLFTDLPHMIGQISNLSGNQVRRAMVSIKSENRRRQRIFTEHGVNNINLYTRLLKNNEATVPVPHLFIIIDEFAELKREEPEFMKELISVAQVGRSLGVHLILATQKPSGTVDDNIWSNTKFRLCLRVADKADSKDMLHKPDAAYITQAGRCYLQVGNDEVFELFQSGWSGAVYDESEMGVQENIATMLTVNGKAAIIGSKNKIRKKEKAKLAWITQLVQVIISSAERVAATVEQAQSNVGIQTKLIEQTFLVLKEMGIDYPDSQYNKLRLEDFIKLWPNEMENPTEIAQAIIQRAMENGKKLPEIKEKTQLDAVVEYLREVAETNGYTHNLQLWMPLLPTKMYLSDLAGYNEYCFDGNTWKEPEKWSLETVIGLCDDPENQAQMPLTVSFSETGHYAVCGSVVSGKSTFLQSVVYGLITRYSPQYVNLYLMDFSSQMLGAFEGCAHVGGVMYESDLDRINKCFNLISQMLEERKKLFRGGNYSQYVQVHGVTLPAIVVVIDNMANFREKTGDKYADTILTLSRDAAGYGIYFLISSAGFGSTEIPNKVRDNIRTVICLEMGDKFKYMDVLAGPRFDIMPEADIKGRGLAILNGTVLEFQTAMALPANDDYERSEKIREKWKIMNEKWTGMWAKTVPEIPEEPVLFDYCQLPEYTELLNTGTALPIGYNQVDASLSYIDLRKTFCYMVSGRNKTGKANFIKILMEDISRMEAQVCVFDAPNGKLKKAAANYGMKYITNDQDMYNYWEEMIPEFMRRNKLKNEYLAEDLEEDEIYEKMAQETPIFIIVGNLKAFVNSLYNPAEDVGKMNGFMENILEKGVLHNFYFIVAADTEDVVEVSMKTVFMNMKKYKTGIHLGGNVSAQKIFRFTNIPYKEEGKNTPPGVGLTPSEMDDSEAVKVVIPLVK